MWAAGAAPVVGPSAEHEALVPEAAAVAVEGAVEGAVEPAARAERRRPLPG
jgi:hypothetical protein